MSDKKYVGIEIGGSKLQLVLGDENAAILERYRHVVDRNAGGGEMRRQIESTLKEIRFENVAAIGVGYGGPVDRLKGKALVCHHATGWSGFPLAQWLSDLTGVPAVVENDGNTGALGEAVSGAGRGFNHVFYITLGSGVGSGLVVNGVIYHGAFPGEAEIGHVRLDKTGRIVESSCSGWSVDRKIREAANENPESILTGLVRSNDGPEAKVLAEALKQGDPSAIKILEDTCDDLAFGISHVVQLIHPDVVVLGGGLSLLGEPLRAFTEQKIPGYVMDVFQPGPPVRLSQLMEDAVPLGALLLAKRHDSQ
jgi:glucokinase